MIVYDRFWTQNDRNSMIAVAILAQALRDRYLKSLFTAAYLTQYVGQPRQRL